MCNYCSLHPILFPMSDCTSWTGRLILVPVWKPSTCVGVECMTRIHEIIFEWNGILSCGFLSVEIFGAKQQIVNPALLGRRGFIGKKWAHSQNWWEGNSRHLGISTTLPSCSSSATRLDMLPACSVFNSVQDANSRKGMPDWSKWVRPLTLGDWFKWVRPLTLGELTTLMIIPAGC